MKQLWVVVATFLLFLSNSLAQKNPVLSAGKFEEETRLTGGQILDVRTMEEYTSGHIKHSLQADWTDPKQFTDRIQHLDKTKPIYVYCASGARSSNAAKFLRKQGFRVFELQSGITAWNRNNLPLERDSVVQQMTMSGYFDLVGSSSTVLIDFGAKWCPPCKKMEPVVQELQESFGTKFSLIKIDAGVHSDVMRNLRVELMPTFILYKNGKEVWRKEGLVTLEEFKAHLQ